MIKKIVSVLLIILITSSGVFGANEIDLQIKGKSSLLMDYSTGKIIYSSNKDEKLAPASITKIMTLLLGMEALESKKIKLDDEVVISSHASGMGGTQVYLDTGETQTVENLFLAISIRSANDAAVALGEYISGSEEIFVKLMNQRAKELGMENTNFVNSSGLPAKDHYTTAYDVALMSRELLKHTKVHDWLTIYMQDMMVGKSKNSVQTMVNTNRLIKEYEGANGIKTGSTSEAGYCVSGSAKRGNLQLIAVVMGADNARLRFDEAIRLLDYGFSNYESVAIGRKGETVSKLPVEKGEYNEMEIVLKEDCFVLLPKGSKGKVEREIGLPDTIFAPIDEGTVLGELIVKLDGEEIERVDLIPKEKVGKSNLRNILKKIIKSFLNN